MHVRWLRQRSSPATPRVVVFVAFLHRVSALGHPSSPTGVGFVCCGRCACRGCRVLGTEVLTEFFIEGQGGSLCAPFAGEAGAEGGMATQAGSLVASCAGALTRPTSRHSWGVWLAGGMDDGLLTGALKASLLLLLVALLHREFRPFGLLSFDEGPGSLAVSLVVIAAPEGAGVAGAKANFSSALPPLLFEREVRVVLDGMLKISAGKSAAKMQMR